MALRSSSRSRAGFTLIELLVVIAIIAVLVSLLGAGIFYAYARMTDTAVQSEIQQLQASMQAFKAKYGVYPPQRIRLCSDSTWYGTKPTKAALGGPQFDVDSLSFINRLWPNIGVFSQANSNMMDWSGTGNPVDEILEGDQVLVFFLGGIPWTSPTGGGTPVMTASNGFSANGKNPTLAAFLPNGTPTNVGRVSSFYSFPVNRLYFRSDPSGLRPTSQYFPSFQDYYGQSLQTGERAGPYLYFSSHNRANGYNPYFSTLGPSAIAVWNYNSGGAPAAVSVLAYYQVAPAAGSLGKYNNPATFQIVSAGRDGNFNSVDPNYPNAFLWAPSITGNLTPWGRDDFANFTGSRLEAAQ